MILEVHLLNWTLLGLLPPGSFSPVTTMNAHPHPSCCSVVFISMHLENSGQLSCILLATDRDICSEILSNNLLGGTRQTIHDILFFFSEGLDCTTKSQTAENFLGEESPCNALHLHQGNTHKIIFCYISKWYKSTNNIYNQLYCQLVTNLVVICCIERLSIVEAYIPICNSINLLITHIYYTHTHLCVFKKNNCFIKILIPTYYKYIFIYTFKHF